MRARDLPAPYVTSAIFALVLVAAAGWGWRSGAGDTLRTARLERTKARMTDGICVFTADFHLVGLASRVRFATHQQDIRDAILGLMRTKSRYMVETEAARQGLAVQMRNVAAHTAGAVADQVRFAEFTVF